MAERDTVLVIDDDEGIRCTLWRILDDHGYEIETAETGREALEKAKGECFKVAFVDIRLPDCEGSELVRPLKEVSPGTEVVLVTGYAAVESAVRALNDGASAYLTKPLNMDAVLALVDQIAEKQHLTEEKRRAEDALRESEAKYSTLVEQASDGVDIVQDGVVKFANRALCEMTGYSQEELARMDFLDMVEPECRDEVRKRYFARLAGEKPPAVAELWIRRKDGTRRCVEATGSLIEYNGRSASMGIIRDVTWRKRAEESLRESEARYRLIMENISDVVFTTDMDLRYTYISPSVTRLRGFTVEEAAALRIEENLAPRGLEVVLKTFGSTGSAAAGAAQGDLAPGCVELEHYCKDGSTLWAETCMSVIRDPDGRPVGLLGVTRDIDARKRAELELAEYRRRLEELVEERTAELEEANRQLQQEIAEHERAERELKIKDWSIASSINAIVMVDLKGNVLYGNASFLEMWGFESGDEISGQPAAELWDDQKEAARVIRALLRKGLWRGELVARRGDGSTFDVQVLASLVEDDCGKPICFMASLIDVTGRNRAEEKLRRLYDRERELREQIEAEMGKRVEFTRALAHELKTPLTPVVMSSQILTSKLEDELLLRVAKNIERGASNLNSRIDELLDLARGEVGMLHIRLERVDLLELLREVVEEVSAVPASRGQRLVAKLPPELPEVTVDRVRVKQVVMNLLNNAFKYTPEGGRITLRAKQDEGNVVVEVRDTGPGIGKEDLKRLFNPYHRIDSDRERLSGLGLGLALCKTLVELHGGSIWVRSRVGKGSTFGFSLPVAGPCDE